MEYNYRIKLEETRKPLDSWSWRLLSIIDKIEVIKSHAISEFIHLLTTLPTPGDSFLKELETLFFSFILVGKGNKIARKTIINDMIEYQSSSIPHLLFAKGLKISWIKKSMGRKSSGRLEKAPIF